VHETVFDLFGQEDARASLPLANLVRGRSLLRPYWGDPVALLATSTAVWEPDDARFGAMRGDRVVIGAPNAWQCFDTRADPGEHKPLPERVCDDLLALVQQRFVGAR
jgi:hypothetical protein